MRTFEAALVTTLAMALVIMLLPVRRRVGMLDTLQIVLVLGAALIFQLHAFVEGPRRGLLDVYATGFVLLAVTALRFFQRSSGGEAVGEGGLARVLELTGAFLGLGILAVAVATA